MAWPRTPTTLEANFFILRIKMGRGDEPSYDPLMWGNSPFVKEGRRVQNKLATIVFSVLYGGVFLGSFCAYHNA
jgi:hypothetical protein